MSISIKFACPYCDAIARVPAKLAGKQGMCPTCEKVIEVPRPEGEEETRELSPAAAGNLPKKAKPAAPTPLQAKATQVCAFCAEAFPADADKCKFCGEGIAGSGSRGEYADCPKCRCPGRAEPVRMTWWGGLLGPKLFSHVKCSQCSTAYNGKTGKSNKTVIGIYLAVSTLVCLGIGLLILLGA